MGKYNSPMSGKLENPLSNGEKIKRAKAGQQRTYAKMGMKPLNSPLKK